MAQAVQAKFTNNYTQPRLQDQDHAVGFIQESDMNIVVLNGEEDVIEIAYYQCQICHEDVECKDLEEHCASHGTNFPIQNEVENSHTDFKVNINTNQNSQCPSLLAIEAPQRIEVLHNEEPSKNELQKLIKYVNEGQVLYNRNTETNSHQNQIQNQNNNLSSNSGPGYSNQTSFSQSNNTLSYQQQYFVDHHQQSISQFHDSSVQINPSSSVVSTKYVPSHHQYNNHYQPSNKPDPRQPNMSTNIAVSGQVGQGGYVNHKYDSNSSNANQILTAYVHKNIANNYYNYDSSFPNSNNAQYNHTAKVNNNNFSSSVVNNQHVRPLPMQPPLPYSSNSYTIPQNSDYSVDSDKVVASNPSMSSVITREDSLQNFYPATNISCNSSPVIPSHNHRHHHTASPHSRSTDENKPYFGNSTNNVVHFNFPGEYNPASLHTGGVNIGKPIYSNSSRGDNSFHLSNAQAGIPHHFHHPSSASSSPHSGVGVTNTDGLFYNGHNKEIDFNPKSVLNSHTRHSSSPHSATTEEASSPDISWNAIEAEVKLQTYEHAQLPSHEDISPPVSDYSNHGNTCEQMHETNITPNIQFSNSQVPLPLPTGPVANHEVQATTESSDILYYPCELCRDKFSSTISLVQHVNSFHRCKLYQCDKCGKQFEKQHGLLAHVNRMHNPMKDRLAKKSNKRASAKWKEYDVNSYNGKTSGKQGGQISQDPYQVPPVTFQFEFICLDCQSVFPSCQDLKVHQLSCK